MNTKQESSPSGLGQGEVDDLEQLVNTHGVDSVLYALSGICQSKSAQIREINPDDDLADTWGDSADSLAQLAKKTNV